MSGRGECNSEDKRGKKTREEEEETLVGKRMFEMWKGRAKKKMSVAKKVCLVSLRSLYQLSDCVHFCFLPHSTNRRGLITIISHWPKDWEN